MTQSELELQTQLEPTPSDLTTQPLFNDSPVLFLEPIDNVHARTSEQVEQTEHNTSSKVHTPPDKSHETPPPPKKTIRNHKRPYISLSTHISAYFTSKTFTFNKL